MSGEFHVGPWLVQPSLCRISRDERSTRIRAKLMDLLVYLAEHPNQVVSKQDLLNEVWRTEAVSESALTRSITELRQALEDSVHDPQIIETIPKRGYRLIARVFPASVEPDTANTTTAPRSLEVEGAPSRLSAYRWSIVAGVLIVVVGGLAAMAAKMTVRPKSVTEHPWFEEVTTKSPRALRAYVLGASLMPDRSEEAIPHLRDALREDPEFASAHILLAYALFNKNGQASEYLTHAEAAFRFSADTTAAERHFIAASLFSLQAEAATDVAVRQKHQASAISEFEAAVRLQPDNIWALTNLAEAYAELGRRPDSARLFVQLADLQPASLTVLARTANVVLESSGVRAAEPFFARATRLLDSGGAGVADPHLRQFVEFFPAHQAWLNGDGHKATALVDAAVARRQADYDDACWFRLGTFRLSLGQLHQAEEAFAHVRAPNLRSLGFAELAIAHDDQAGAIDHIHAYPRHSDPAAVSVSVRAGDLGLAARLLHSMTDVQPAHRQWAEEEIREAAGDRAVISRAVARGAPWVEVMAGVRAFMYSETLARAAASLGDGEGAIRVLAQTDRVRDGTLLRTAHSGYFFLRTQLLLADLYRQAGRGANAERIELATRGALAASDPDFPLLVALSRRGERADH